MAEPRVLENIRLLSVSLVDHPPHPSWTIEKLSPERHSMLETMRYTRKPFDIDAVQVSTENIAEVAKWVDGEIRTDDVGQYVKVRVHRPLNDRQTKAYIGDWVLYAGTGYKCYTPKAFANSFDLVSSESVMVDTDNIKRTKNAVVTRDEVQNDEIENVLEGNVVVPKRKKPTKRV